MTYERATPSQGSNCWHQFASGHRGILRRGYHNGAISLGARRRQPRDVLHGALARSLALVVIVLGGLMFMFGEAGVNSSKKPREKLRREECEAAAEDDAADLARPSSFSAHSNA
jgi:hypothetical protein